MPSDFRSATLNSLSAKVGSSWRVDTNSSSLPSGEKVGSKSLPIASLTMLSREAAISNRWMARWWLSRMVLKASHLPSGEKDASWISAYGSCTTCRGSAPSVETSQRLWLPSGTASVCPSGDQTGV